ncbi:MAG: dockerin type I domain-containing protein, partial [Pseudomonadota bacterium]
NADGFDDVVFGASRAQPNGSFSGEAYVVFGTDQGFPAQLTPPDLNGENGFVIEGETAFAYTGSSVSGAGDFNGDGIDDVLIGARGSWIFNQDQTLGRSYVVFGRDAGVPATLPLAELDSSTGLRMIARGENDFLGYSVSAAGDFNGDGISDVLAGAPFRGYFDGYWGRAFMVFGASTGLPAELPLQNLDGANGLMLDGGSSGGYYTYAGNSVSSAGDLNGDGLDDVIIGARRADDYYGGESYVVFGDDTDMPEALSLRGLDGTRGFRITSISDYDEAGGSVSGAGDINGDGFDDVLIGADRAEQDLEKQGEVYVIYGTDQGFAAIVDPAALDGNAGFVVRGAEEGDAAGTSVQAAGDVNGDGMADIIIGAVGSGPDDRGQAFVVFGRADTDGDGVQDTADNCSELANSGQRDSNGDGFGNLCDADLNGDCAINFSDLAVMKAAFFSNDKDADLDGNGTVSFVDLALLKATFFGPPGPSGLPTACNARDRE